MAEGNLQEEKPPTPSDQAKKNGINDGIPPPFVTIPEAELGQLKQDMEVYRDKYLRLLAEIDNTRKRLQKEKHELTQFAVQRAVLDMLSPIDHLENALKYTQQASEEIKHWALGFQMILNQFKEALSQNGVTPFVSVGTPFDPHLHEAVEMVITKDHPPGIVIEESLRGYKMGDQTIRPARVKVTKAPEEDRES